MKAVKSVFRNPPLLTFLLVALVWLVASLTLRGFGAYGHLRYLLELAAVIGIVAAGQTLVILMGGIDLSVGAVITVTAILLPLISPASDPTGLVGIVLVLAIATGIGLLNGAGAAYLRVPPIIMTLAMATFLQGLLVIVAGGSAVTVSNPAVILLGQARPLGVPAGIILWIVVSIAVLLIIHRTPLGARFLALGANPLAARLSGVSVARNTLLLYALSGFFAGLAGILVLGMNRQGYVGIGDPYLLMSIAAVVLGGTSILGGRGTYAGTIPGAILLVTTTALITVVNASPGWRSIMFGSLILALLLISGREARR
ncbi:MULTISPECIES: ABC transporter permease [unclassified Shinella]|jgi:ribose transport system permease protein|uniref:ABC transporter permease n=1 Tax=unclassified Shinella TaxID=2643062 RepID=UPI0003C55B5A|nr:MULTISPECIES: ABC transporter permease [unclassified Shinella]MCA0343951.1 ABC transporter permease [Pseudomonadota bacterium]EYR78467.1 ribose transport system permease protein RbsC [Shinella sp. DD12]KNY15062.1 ABC transporter permease [Shinella sp. SUS2]KOC74714.1 ABC transporter permease [Shinella sp. GWS1]MCO5154866.1 ABC transporter permease [Shinella sp.]